MSQTVTISKTEFEKLTERIKKLEAYVFGKKPNGADQGKQVRAVVKKYKTEKLKGTLKMMKTPDEILTPRQEAILTKQYEKAKRDFARGEGVVVTSVDEMMKHLRS